MDEHDGNAPVLPVPKQPYWKLLFIDPHTGYPDGRKIMQFICAAAFLFTWGRMSLNYPVDKALYNPTLWVVLYGLLACHELIDRAMVLIAKWKGVAVDLPNTSSNNNGGN